MDRILHVSLGSLNQLDVPAIFPGAQLEDWSLPGEGKIALSSYGLPSARADDLMGVVAEFQGSAEPESGVDGLKYYVLGHYGTAKLVAMRGGGGVLAVPQQSQVHTAMQSTHPSGILPVFVNSSIECLVECAWRWHGVVALLAEEQRNAGEAEIRTWREGGYDASVDPYAEYHELCKSVLVQFKVIDERVQDADDFWSDVIVDVW